MKKNATRYCALALLITGCAQPDVYCSKQTGSSTKRETSPIISSFWNWAKKTVDAAKICGGAENVVKTEASKHSLNGLLGFIIFIILRWKRVCIAHNNCWLTSIWATLSALLINMLLGSFQLFLHSDQPL